MHIVQKSEEEKGSAQQGDTEWKGSMTVDNLDMKQAQWPKCKRLINSKGRKIHSIQTKGVLRF